MELDLTTIATGIIAVLGVWFKINQILWKKIATKGIEFYNSVDKAIDENSPGGKVVTEDEAKEIGIKAVELVYVFKEDKVIQKWFKKKS